MKKQQKATINLLVLSAFFVLLFFAFYPTQPQMSDEAEYSRNAHNLLKGVTSVDSPELSYNFVGDQEKYFSRYPQTASLFLLPLMPLGQRALFITSLAFFFLGLYFFVKLLDENKLSRAWGFLYLSYVPFLFHTTTLMIDLPSAALILGAFLYHQKKKPYLTGLLLGIALLLKNTNVLALAIIGLISIYRYQARWKEFFSYWARVASTFFPFMFVFFAHNHHMYGGILKSGYFFLQNNVLTITGLPNFADLYLQNVSHYFTFLLIFMPGMLLLALLGKYKLKAETLAYTFVTVFVLSAINNLPSLRIEDLIINYRFVFVAVPPLLVGYAAFIEQKILDKIKPVKRNLTWILAIACAITLVCSIPLLDIKSQASERTAKITQDIYSNVPEGSLVVGIKDAQYFSEHYGNIGYLSLRYPAGYEEAEKVVEEKIDEYLEDNRKVYLLYLDTPDFETKGVSEQRDTLDEIRQNHASAIIFESSYPVKGVGYSSTIRLELVEISKSSHNEMSK